MNKVIILHILSNILLHVNDRKNLEGMVVFYSLSKIRFSCFYLLLFASHNIKLQHKMCGNLCT